MVTLRGLRERGELGQLCVSELGAGHEAGVAAPDEGHHQVRELLSGYKYFLNFSPEGPCIHNKGPPAQKLQTSEQRRRNVDTGRLWGVVHQKASVICKCLLHC